MTWLVLGVLLWVAQAQLGVPPLSKRSCKSAPNMNAEERLPPGVSKAGFD